MSQLLLSNKPPARFSTYQGTQEVFGKHLKECDYVRMATGYISSDSLIDLNRVIEVNKGPAVDIMIGMHYFEGFTRVQYDAAKMLHDTLKKYSLGSVYISNTHKFHGKMYSFYQRDIPSAMIVGSSNLDSCLSKFSSNYEADVIFTSPPIVIQYAQVLKELIEKLAVPFDHVQIDKFIEHNALLENHYGVEKVTESELLHIKSNLTNIRFQIPTKTKPKSNLNIYFGTGRKDKRGFETPRPWYEVELIVPKSILSNPSYPLDYVYEVITDDGWKFKCMASGDYKKNLRSYDDLKILGKWIKGRLEISNSLKIGNPVTEEVLRHYGRNNIDLIKTKVDNLWFLNFKP